MIKNIYENFVIKANEIAVNSFTDSALDMIKGLLIIFLAIIITGTIIFLFLSIFKIAQAKDDQEERAEKIKHSIIVVVCLIIEVGIITLISTLM